MKNTLSIVITLFTGDARLLALFVRLLNRCNACFDSITNHANDARIVDICAHIPARFARRLYHAAVWHSYSNSFFTVHINRIDSRFCSHVVAISNIHMAGSRYQGIIIHGNDVISNLYHMPGGRALTIEQLIARD